MKKVAASTCGGSTVFLILLLAVFFMLVYVYAAPVTAPIYKAGYEKFSDDKGLIPSDKLVVFQGNTLPDVQVSSVTYDNHESLPPVDGTDYGSKAMFMMAYNKCDPSCCPSTYSCNGGCVCMTKDQQNFIGTRGKNSQSARCTGEIEY